MGLTIDAKKILLQKRLLQDIKRKSKDENEKILKEVLINCEKRINRMPSYKSSTSSHKLPSNHNLRQS